MNKKGILIVVSGFSGAGKGTVMKALMKKYDNYALSISATTRDPRIGEENGREYFFKTTNEFEYLIENDEMLEHANYVGNYYGTPRKYVNDKLEEGKDVLLEIEIQGALQVKEKFPDAVLMFMMPPSVEELEKRLVGRGTEDAPTIKSRMLRAKEESQGIEKYDYIIINDDIDTCVGELNNIVKSEHHRSKNNLKFIEQVKGNLDKLLEGE